MKVVNLTGFTVFMLKFGKNYIVICYVVVWQLGNERVDDPYC